MNEVLSSFAPKYIQIKEAIAKEIAEKKYREGDRIPSENELPKLFDVSKMTAVKAIDELVREGILYKEKGRGTFVASQTQVKTLTIGTFGYLDFIIDLFEEKNPDINITRIPYEPDNYIETVDTNDIDVLQIIDLYFNYFAGNQRLVDLTDYFWDEISHNHYYEEVLSIFEFRRKQYAMPAMFSPLVMFYNKNAFKDAGLVTPSSGWSWNDFLQTAKTLTTDADNDGFVDQYGFIFAQYRNRWPVYVLQNGGRIMSQPDEQCTIGSPEAIEAIQWALDLLYKHKVCPIYPQLSRSLSQQLFIDGKVSMVIDSYYSLHPYKTQKNFDLGICPLPHNKQDTTGLITDGFGISEGTKNFDTALEFIKFSSSPEIQTLIKSRGPGIPVIKSIAEGEQSLPDNINADDYMTFQTVLPNAQKIIDISDPRLLEPFWEKMEMIWSNLEKVDIACKKAETEVNQLIEKLKLDT